MLLFNKVIDATKVWVTSDLHHNHKNICKGVSQWDDKNGCRDFESLDEMNAKIIRGMSIIPQDAILIDLGDIIFGDKNELPNLLRQIPCREHHYILGNHDHWMIDKNGEFKEEVRKQFTSMQFYLEVFARMPSGEKHRVCFSHYPMTSWHDMNRGGIMVHGHCHQSLKHNGGKIIDVGIDKINDYKPYSLMEICKKMEKQQIIKVDHH